jgi:hypothetical protein
MKTRFIILLLAFAACALSQEAFSVIVQKDNPATSITKTQLRRMLMGEGSWPGGGKFVVLIGPVGDSARAAAFKQICGMTEGDFNKHVLQVKFEGGDKQVPKTLASGALVEKTVQGTAGALGIVQAADVGEGVKVLPVE